jgi:hypothetical protein
LHTRSDSGRTTNAEKLDAAVRGYLKEAALSHLEDENAGCALRRRIFVTRARTR